MLSSASLTRACWIWASRSAIAAVAAVIGLGPLMALAEPPHVRPEVMSSRRFAQHLNEQLTTLSLQIGSEAAEFHLTTYRPDGPGPFPVAIYQHGRGPERDYPFRLRSPNMASYLVRRGFAVLVPTRVGYGGLRGALDPDRGSGGCTLRSIEQQAGSVDLHTRAVLAFAREQPWADAKRVLLVGGSVGGHSVIASSARQFPELIGVLNFAGGAGGNPKKRPGQPCNPGRFVDYFAKAGRTSRVPTLWVYAVNDKFWGPDHPVRWYEAFKKAGGRAELAMLPPVGDDGHFLQSAGFKFWRPIADRFLLRLGFPPPSTPGNHTPSGFASLEDLSVLPTEGSRTMTAAYSRFLGRDLPRAFVIGRKGAWSYTAGRQGALESSLARCAKRTRAACKAYAIDDMVVWKP